MTDSLIGWSCALTPVEGSYRRALWCSKAFVCAIRTRFASTHEVLLHMCARTSSPRDAHTTGTSVPRCLGYFRLTIDPPQNTMVQLMLTKVCHRCREQVCLQDRSAAYTTATVCRNQEVRGTPRRLRRSNVGEEGPQGLLERTEVDRSGPSGARAGFRWQDFPGGLIREMPS